MSSFHDFVFSLRPKNQKTKPTTYWVAVLKSVTTITVVNEYREEDFLWIKCHGNISVKTIHEQYTAEHPEEGELKLKLGSKVPSDATLIRDLDEFNDRLIVFEPKKSSDHSFRASIKRVPLQLIQHQVTVKPDADEPSSKSPPIQNENVRPEHHSPYRTPYLESSYTLPPTPCSTAAHLAQTIPVTRINSIPAAADASSSVALPISSQYVTSATPEWAIPQGFEVFADQHQEKYRLRDPSLDASRLQLANLLKGLCSNTM